MDNSHRFFKNGDCRFYPCHEGIGEINCLFCYCPLYSMENCPGNPIIMEQDGKKTKNCTECFFPHQAENYDRILELIKSMEG